MLDRLAKEDERDPLHRRDSLAGRRRRRVGRRDGRRQPAEAGAGRAASLRCIGSTTFNDVKQSFDRDRALSRRFQKIDVLEPSEAETLEILKGLRPHYEAHHGVQLHGRGARGGGGAVGASTSRTCTCPTRRSTCWTRPARRRSCCRRSSAPSRSARRRSSRSSRRWRACRCRPCRATTSARWRRSTPS